MTAWLQCLISHCGLAAFLQSTLVIVCGSYKKLHVDQTNKLDNTKHRTNNTPVQLGRLTKLVKEECNVVLLEGLHLHQVVQIVLTELHH